MNFSGRTPPARIFSACGFVALAAALETGAAGPTPAAEIQAGDLIVADTRAQPSVRLDRIAAASAAITLVA